MNKSINVSLQPKIKQDLNFIDLKYIYLTANKYQSDRYAKKFTTYVLRFKNEYIKQYYKTLKKMLF